MLLVNTSDISGCDKDAEQLAISDTSSPTQSSSGSNCWILVQQNHGNDEQFFNRNWNDYRQGFGDASGNFWIGNKHLHQMTQLLNNGWQFDVYHDKNYSSDIWQNVYRHRCVLLLDITVLVLYKTNITGPTAPPGARALSIRRTAARGERKLLGENFKRL